MSIGLLFLYCRVDPKVRVSRSKSLEINGQGLEYRRQMNQKQKVEEAEGRGLVARWHRSQLIGVGLSVSEVGWREKVHDEKGGR